MGRIAGLLALVGAFTAAPVGVASVIVPRALEPQRIDSVLSSPSGDKIVMVGDAADDACLRGGVFVSDGDGGNLFRVPAGGAYRYVTVARITTDASRVAWIDNNCGIGPNRLVRAETTRGGSVQTASIQGGGLDGFVLMDDGTVWVGAGGSKGPRVRVARWGGAPALVPEQPVGTRWGRGHTYLARAFDHSRGTGLGTCTALRRTAAEPARIAFGLLDMTHSVLRVGVAPRGITVLDQCLMSANGRRVIATAATPGGTRYLLQYDGSRTRVRRLPKPLQSVVSLSPDHRWVVLEGYTSAGWTSGIIRLGSPGWRRLALGAGVGFQNGGARLWSRDRRMVALVGWNRLRILETATGATRTLLLPKPSLPGEKIEAFGDVRWSPDSETLFYSVDTNSQPNTNRHAYAVGVASGVVTDLFKGGLDSFGDIWFSPDGTRAWVTPSTTCSRVYPVPLFTAAPAGLGATPFTIGT